MELLVYGIGVVVSTAIAAFAMGYVHQQGEDSSDYLPWAAAGILAWPLFAPIVILGLFGFGISRLGVATARAIQRRKNMRDLSPEEMADKLLEGQRL